MAMKKISTETANRFCCLVVGQAGMGKTSLLRTIMGQDYDAQTGQWSQREEVDHKVCTLSAEAGLLCVRDLVQAGKVEGYEIGSLQDFKEALAALMQPDFQTRYNWIFIDSLTEISSRCVEAMKIKHQSAKDNFKLWGEYNEIMTQIIKAFRDMTAYNVVFTCLESVDKDENNARYPAPAISGKGVKELLTSYFDLVLRMEEVTDDKGQPCRVFNTCRPIGLAKDRSGKLKQQEKPDLLYIQRKILA